MYDAINEGLFGTFKELQNGACFTSTENKGNVYQKLGDMHCRLVDYNHDDDEIILELHESFPGGIAHDVYNQICLIDPDFDVTVYSKYIPPGA